MTATMREISPGTVHMNYFKVILEAVVFQNTDSKPYSRAEVVFPNLGILAKVHENTKIAGTQIPAQP